MHSRWGIWRVAYRLGSRKLAWKGSAWWQGKAAFRSGSWFPLRVFRRVSLWFSYAGLEVAALGGVGKGCRKVLVFRWVVRGREKS